MKTYPLLLFLAIFLFASCNPNKKVACDLYGIDGKYQFEANNELRTAYTLSQFYFLSPQDVTNYGGDKNTKLKSEEKLKGIVLMTSELENKVKPKPLPKPKPCGDGIWAVRLNPYELVIMPAFNDHFLINHASIIKQKEVISKGEVIGNSLIFPDFNNNNSKITPGTYEIQIGIKNIELNIDFTLVHSQIIK